MQLSIEHIRIIREEVQRQRVEHPRLRDDLVDHLCCEVEERLRSGKRFEDCLEEAMSDLAPQGLITIQEETCRLLNAKKMIHMKRLVFLTGLLSTMSCSLGLLFRLMHMPGANELILFGFMGFVLLFLPLSMVAYWRAYRQSSFIEKLKSVTGTGSGAIAGIGLLFKFMHFPGGNELLLGGGLMFTFLYLPVYFYEWHKRPASDETARVNV